MHILKRYLIQPEYFFLSCALVIGFVFVFLTPPMQTYDEQDHFFRAYQLSDINIVPDLVTLTPTRPSLGPGGMLPTNLLGFAYDFLYSTRLAKTPDEKISNLKKNHEKYKYLKTNPDTMGAAHFPNTGSYSPIVYIPQTIGIELGKMARLPIMVFFYVSRIFNLVVWTILVFVALRLLQKEKLKWYFVAIALLPGSIFQAATLSADVLTNGLVMLVVAIFISKLYINRVITKRELAIIIGATASVSLCKPGFWPLSALFFLLPASIYGSKHRRYIIPSIIVGLNLLVTLVWMTIIRFVVPYIGQIYRVGENIHYEKQLQFIINHPANYMVLGIKEFFTPMWLGYWSKNAIGILGWGEAPLPLWAYFFIGLVVLFCLYAVATAQKPIILNKKVRIVSATILMGMIAYMATTLYLTYTPVGQGRIDGIQGRYFVPYLTLLLPITLGVVKRIPAPLHRIIRNMYIFTPLAILIWLMLAVYAIYARYYA